MLHGQRMDKPDIVNLHGLRQTPPMELVVIFKHSSSTKHPRANDSHFEVLESNYDSKQKLRLVEAMHIRNMKPTLNIQKKKYKCDVNFFSFVSL